MPNGGCILNYLLEKSRVVSHAKNERNFHIFYQIIYGASDQTLESLKLIRNLNEYTYLRYKAASHLVEDQNDDVMPSIDVEKDNLDSNEMVNFIDDITHFKNMYRALEICEFTHDDRLVEIFFYF